MPIFTATPPSGTDKVISESVRVALHSSPEAPESMGAGPEDIALPHQVHALGLQDVPFRDLSRAQKLGWRYLVLQGEQPIATAETTASPTNARPKFSNLNFGPFVQKTVTALKRAEGLNAAQTEDFELRLLTVPALYVIALWLHGKSEDLLVPMTPIGQQPVVEGALTPTEFFDQLIPAIPSGGANENSAEM